MIIRYLDPWDLGFSDLRIKRVPAWFARELRCKRGEFTSLEALADITVEMGPLTLSQQRLQGKMRVLHEIVSEADE